MKNSIILLLILGLVSWISCEKSSDQEASNGLTGTWNLVAITGGIAGNGYQANFDAIHFDQGSFDLLKNKAKIFSGTYTLNAAADTFKITSTATEADPFLNIKEKKISTDKGNLILSEPCCDLYNYEFSKGSNE